MNTHKPASPYKRYPPAEARWSIRHLEIHYTPKHGSWLNMVEIEVNVMTRQYLDRRTGDIELLRHELMAWECSRNNSKGKIIWQFRATDIRVKLVSLYPLVLSANE